MLELLCSKPKTYVGAANSHAADNVFVVVVVSDKEIVLLQTGTGTTGITGAAKIKTIKIMVMGSSNRQFNNSKVQINRRRRRISPT